MGDALYAEKNWHLDAFLVIVLHSQYYIIHEISARNASIHCYEPSAGTIQMKPTYADFTTSSLTILISKQRLTF